MAKKLKLPEVKTQDIQSGYLSIRPEDLKLSFSVVTLRAGDAAEKAFRETLLNSEDERKELQHEPMAFPVFGRGRALNALVGKGINADMIDEATAFLSGPCSCQVKRQNPGFDLLTSVDWDQLLENQIRAYDDRAQAKISVEDPPTNPLNSKPPARPWPQIYRYILIFGTLAIVMRIYKYFKDKDSSPNENDVSDG